jgi:hypothetical protein
VQDPSAPQAAEALANLVHERASDDARVVGEVLLGYGYGLQHYVDRPRR